MFNAFYFWGDVAVVALFAVIYFYFCKTYDAFLISHYRIFDIIASQSLALLFTDGLMYVITVLLCKHFPNPFPLSLTKRISLLFYTCQNSNVLHTADDLAIF